MKPQPKASIVVTCYNKEKYIARMFDSILKQKWNNIEVVLVNDGSTDRTREIIAKYETKFKKRGYSVVIIDQKNSGVITAAKNGLLACTGDYFCIIDADDKLDPEYVSLPVSTLEKNKKFDYTMCSFYYLNFDDPKVEPDIYKIPIKDGEKDMLSCYLLSKIMNVPWLYMVRSSYLKKDFLEKSYRTKSKGTHEPGFNVPLMALNGKVKVINKPLYFWNRTISSSRHSYFSKYNGIKKHLIEYCRLTKLAINSLPQKILNDKLKKQFILQAEFKKMRALLFHSFKDEFILDGSLYKKRAFENLLKFANIRFKIKASKNIYHYIENNIMDLFDNILFVNKGEKRIICYGTMGKVAKRWLPFLQPLLNLKFQVELWDKNGDGKKIKKPNFKDLKKSDIMFVFPSNKDIVKDVKKDLRNVGFKNALFNPSEWTAFLLSKS